MDKSTTSNNLRNFVLIFVGIILMGVMVVATTTISDTDIFTTGDTFIGGELNINTIVNLTDLLLQDRTLRIFSSQGNVSMIFNANSSALREIARERGVTPGGKIGFVGDVDNFDNINAFSRFSETNIHNGSNASAGFIGVNDVGNSLSIGIASSTFNFLNITLANIGAIRLRSPADMFFINDFIRGWVWVSDQNDTTGFTDPRSVMTLSAFGNLDIIGNYSGSGDMNITGSYFGDGSQLTGVAGAGLWTNSSGDATYVDGGVGIGTIILNSSALLHLSSTTQGFLPPQMTDVQRDAISNPASGLIIYDTDGDNVNYFNGNSWKRVVSTPISTLTNGSIIIGQGGGEIHDDPTNLFWDFDNKGLGIGTNTPLNNLHITTGNTTSALAASINDSGLIITGSNRSRIYLENTASDPGERVFTIVNEDGQLKFESLTDDGVSGIHEGIFIIDHVGGRVGIGDSPGEGKLHIHQDSSGQDAGIVIEDIGGGTFRMYHTLNNSAVFQKGNNLRQIELDNSGSVAFGGGSPDEYRTALLTISSTTKGILIPRMNSTERDAIISPQTGLLIYNLENNSFNYFENSEWNTILSTPASTLSNGSILISKGGGNIDDDPANLFWDDVNNRLGVGTNTPNATLDVNGSINFNGNLTVGERITFALGEFIDNLVDGWIRVNGNLNVTGIANIGTITIDGSTTTNRVSTGDDERFSLVGGSDNSEDARMTVYGRSWITPNLRGTIDFTAGNNANAKIDFGLDKGGTVTYGIRIDNAGNVGIGATPTSGKLHVFQVVDNSTGGLTVEGTGGTTFRMFLSSINTAVFQKGTNTNQLVLNDDGTVDFANQIKILGGSPGIGKILTSDALGFASWENASDGAVTLTRGQTETTVALQVPGDTFGAVTGAFVVLPQAGTYRVFYIGRADINGAFDFATFRLFDVNASTELPLTEGIVSFDGTTDRTQDSVSSEGFITINQSTTIRLEVKMTANQSTNRVLSDAAGRTKIGFQQLPTTVNTILDTNTIFAQLSSSVDQLPSNTSSVPITFNTQDGINGITHSTSTDPSEITIDVAGVYFISPQPQVGKDMGATAQDFDMYLQVDRGSGFVNEPNSNVKLTVKDQDITDVIVSVFNIKLDAGDKIRVMQKVSDDGISMGLKATAATAEVPATPSIIFTMYRVGS